jgi:uncharacterized protein involved in exopolysaccharide biosynthesis
MSTSRQTQTVVVQDEKIIDFKLVGELLGFVRNSIARNTFRFFSIFLTLAIVTTAIALILPKMYQINTKILTHKAAVMPALVHPDRSIPQAADDPTAGAEELLKSRENLSNLLKDIQLEENWEKRRSFLFRFKDQIVTSILGKPSEQDVHESFLKLLDERIKAKVDRDVVSMQVEWPDADIAMNLAEGLVKRFRKIRHDMELGEIRDTVSILERNVETSRQSIEESVNKLASLFSRKEKALGHKTHHKKAAVRRERVVSIRRPQSAKNLDPAMNEMRKALAEKQEQISAVKERYEQNIKKAQEELNALRANLGPEHPDVVEARHHLEQVSRMPRELEKMRMEEARLTGQLASMPDKALAAPKVQLVTVKEPESQEASDAAGDVVQLPVSDELSKQIESDPELSSMMAQLKQREDAHDELLRRLSNARIESETAEIAFEYRYLLTEPPVYPKKYISPNIPVLITGGIVVGIVLGILSVVMKDAFSKRILESWQVERFLKLKVLGEIDK